MIQSMTGIFQEGNVQKFQNIMRPYQLIIFNSHKHGSTAKYNMK